MARRKVGLDPMIRRRQPRITTKPVPEGYVLDPERRPRLHRMEVKGSTAPHTLHEEPAIRNHRLLVRSVLVTQMLNRGAPRVDCFQAWAAQHQVNDRLGTQTWNRGAADMLDREGRGAEASDQEFSFDLEQRRPVQIVRNEINRVFGHQVPSQFQAGLTLSRPVYKSQ